MEKKRDNGNTGHYVYMRLQLSGLVTLKGKEVEARQGMEEEAGGRGEWRGFEAEDYEPFN